MFDGLLILSCGAIISNSWEFFRFIYIIKARVQLSRR